MIKQNAHALAVLYIYIVFFSLPAISDSSAWRKGEPPFGAAKQTRISTANANIFNLLHVFFAVKSYDTIAVARARFDQKTHQMLGCQKQ